MVIYVHRIQSTGGVFGLRTGEVFQVDTEAFTTWKVAEFDNIKDADAFLRAWNGEEKPNA